MGDITWIQPYYDLILYEIPKNVRRILDVGSGYGIFGYILKRSRGCTVDSVDPFDYNTTHYDHHYGMTWGSMYDQITDYYDVIVSTEMIEHMTKEKALEFLGEAKDVSDHVVIATPYHFSDQKEYDGNAFQKHRCVMTPKDFEDNGYRVKFVGTLGFNNRHFASRFYYSKKIAPLLRLVGVKPTNIVGVWKNEAG